MIPVTWRDRGALNLSPGPCPRGGSFGWAQPARRDVMGFNIPALWA
jgi:hypothetical protein